MCASIHDCPAVAAEDACVKAMLVFYAPSCGWARLGSVYLVWADSVSFRLGGLAPRA